MALSRAAITGAGLEILDTYGLGDLSMRRVADTLGVQAGALYYHVPNKQSLLAALADEVLNAVDVPEAGLPLEEWLVAWASALRAALLTRRDGAELVASSLALGLGGIDPTVPAVDRLAEAGVAMPGPTARALLHLVLGQAVTEQTQSQMHALGVLTSFDVRRAEQDFACGVGIFVDGVSSRAPVAR